MTQPLDPNPKGTIGKVCLTSTAAFVCKLYLKYWDTTNKKWVNTDNSSSIAASQTLCAFPSDLGVPTGAQIRVCANVTWGPDYMATEQFIYVQGNLSNVNYTIQGTTQDANLNWTGITAPHQGNAAGAGD